MDNFKLDKKTVYITILTFLVSRASLFGMLPFGYPACCVMLISDTYSVYPYNTVLYIAACLLGTISKGMGLQTYITLLSLALTVCIFYAVKKFINVLSVKMLYLSIIPVGIYSISALAALWVSQPTVGDIVKILIQGLFIFISFYIYRIAEHHINYTKMLTPEELSMLAIIIMLAVLGIPDVVIFGLSLRNILSLLLIMIFSCKGGLGAGAAAGIVIGLLTRYDEPVTICLYTFCGFLSGLFKRYGKFAVVLAFCAGNTVLAFFMGGLPQIISGMYETGMAVIVFILLPRSVSELVRIPVLENNTKDNTIELIYERRMCMNAIKKISEFSNLFKNLSGNVTLYPNMSCSKNRNEEMIRVYNKVCCDCNMRKVCWEQEQDVTKQYLLSAISRISSGSYSKEEMKRSFSDVCINVSQISDELENAYEIKRMNKISNDKINEYRSFISKQLYEIGKMSDGLIEDIKHGMDFNKDKEKKLMTALKEVDIRVLDVIIMNESRNEDYITIYVKGVFKREILEKTVSKILETQYIIRKVSKKSKGVYEVLCITKPLIEANVCVKQYTADGKVCGDSYKIISETPWGQCVAISDGMGVGNEARQQSATVLKIVEMYVKSGVNVQNSMDLINLMLDNGTDEIKTATLDICMINSYEKKAIFSKSGAMDSIIVHKDYNMEIARAGMLPIGTNITYLGSQVRKSEFSIDKGDVIIMYTDGISDSFAKGGMNEKVFTEYLRAVCEKYIKKNQHDSICGQILGQAIKHCKDCEKDDMTIAVISVL